MQVLNRQLALAVHTARLKGTPKPIISLHFLRVEWIKVGLATNIARGKRFKKLAQPNVFPETGKK